MAEPVVLVIDVDDKGSPKVQRFGKEALGAFNDLETKGTRAIKGVGNEILRFPKLFEGAAGSLLKFTAGFAGFQTAVNIFRTGAQDVLGFERALANVGTLGPEIASQLGMFREQILAIPPGLGTAKELTEALYTALSAGTAPAQAVRQVEVAARAAAAGLSDANTVVNALTTTIDAFGLSADDSGRVADVLFRTVQLGKTTFDELAGSFGNVAGITSALGIRFEDASNAIGQLARITGDTRTAATGFRSILTQVIQNMDKFKAAGIDVNATIGRSGFAGLMAELQRVTGGSATELKNFINDIEGLNAAGVFTNKLLNDLTVNQEKTRNATNTVSDAFKVQSATVTAAANRIRESFDRLVNQIAGGDNQAIIQFLDSISQKLQDLAVQAPIIEARMSSVSFVFQALGSAAAKLLQILFNITTFLPRLGIAVGKFLPVGDTVRNFLGGVEDTLDTIGTGLNDVADSLGEGAVKALDNVERLANETNNFDAQFLRQQAAIKKAQEEQQKAAQGTTKAVQAQVRTFDVLTSTVAKTTMEESKNAMAKQQVTDATNTATGATQQNTMANTVNASAAKQSATAQGEAAAAAQANGDAQTQAASAIFEAGSAYRELAIDVRLGTTTYEEAALAVGELAAASLEGANATQELKNQVSEQATQFINNAQRAGELITELEKIGVTQEDLATGAIDLTEEQEKLAKEMGLTRKEAIDMQVEFQVLGAQTKDLGDSLQEAGVDAGMLAQATIDLGGALQNLGPTAAEVDAAMKEAFGSTAREAEAAQNKIKRVFEIIKADGTKSATEILQAFLKATNSMRDEHGKLPAALQPIYDQIAKAAVGAAGEIVDAYKMLGVELPSVTKKAAEDSLSAFNKLRDEGSLSARKLLEVFEKEVLPKVVDANGKMTIEVKTLYGQLQSAARATGQAISDGIGGGAEQAASRAVQSFQQIKNAAADAKLAALREVREAQSGIDALRSDLQESINEGGINTFTTIPFETTVEGLEEQLRSLQRDFAANRSEIGARGLNQFTREQLGPIIAEVERRLMEARIAEAELEERFNETFGGTGIQQDEPNFQNTTREIRSVSRGAALSLGGVADALNMQVSPSLQNACGASQELTRCVNGTIETVRTLTNEFQSIGTANADLSSVDDATQQTQQNVQETGNAIIDVLAQSIQGILGSADQLELSASDIREKITDAGERAAGPMGNASLLILEAAKSLGLSADPIIKASARLATNGTNVVDAMFNGIVSAGDTLVERAIQAAGIIAASVEEGVGEFEGTTTVTTPAGQEFVFSDATGQIIASGIADAIQASPSFALGNVGNPDTGPSAQVLFDAVNNFQNATAQYQAGVDKFASTGTNIFENIRPGAATGSGGGGISTGGGGGIVGGRRTDLSLSNRGDLNASLVLGQQDRTTIGTGFGTNVPLGSVNIPPGASGVMIDPFADVTTVGTQNTGLLGSRRQQTLTDFSTSTTRRSTGGSIGGGIQRPTMRQEAPATRSSQQDNLSTTEVTERITTAVREGISTGLENSRDVIQGNRGGLMTSNNGNDSRSFVGGSASSGVGSGTRTGGGGLALSSEAFRLMQERAAQGRTQDVLGNQGQRQLASAVTPQIRTAIRRREITRDITRNTSLTKTGKPTTK